MSESEKQLARAAAWRLFASDSPVVRSIVNASTTRAEREQLPAPIRGQKVA